MLKFKTTTWIYAERLFLSRVPLPVVRTVMHYGGIGFVYFFGRIGTADCDSRDTAYSRIIWPMSKRMRLAKYFPACFYKRLSNF